MRYLRTFAIEFLALAAVGMSVAQTDQKQAVVPVTERQVAAAQLPQEPPSSPQMEKLVRALEGRWSIKEKLAPDATSPKGTTGDGRIIWRPGPGGFSLVEEYRSRQGQREVNGLGLFWWDEAAQGYRTIWCDSTNPGGCINFKNAVHWKGPQLELVEDYEVKSKRFTFREVFSDITSATFTQTLYGGESGKELKVDQIIQATKLTQGTDREGARK